jgi:Protein of unknown function (DUF664)
MAAAVPITGTPMRPSSRPAAPAVLSAGSSRRRRRLSTAIKESLRELSIQLSLLNGLEQLARYATSSGESPSLRRILIDMIEEYARHVGHADLIRESVDGLTGEDPPD